MKKCLTLLFSILLLIPTYTSAQTSSKPKVLVLYSTQDDKFSNNVQILNTQLGHFTNDITVKKLKKKQLQLITYPPIHILFISVKQKKRFLMKRNNF